MSYWKQLIKCATTPIYITQTFYYNAHGVTHVTTKATYKGAEQTQVISSGNLLQSAEKLLRSICNRYKFCYITIVNGEQRYYGEAWKGKLDINFNGGNK